MTCTLFSRAKKSRSLNNVNFSYKVRDEDKIQFVLPCQKVQDCAVQWIIVLNTVSSS